MQEGSYKPEEGVEAVIGSISATLDMQKKLRGMYEAKGNGGGTGSYQR